MSDTDIITRFVIEPRASYIQHHDTWLVVYDKQTGKYVMDGKSYRRFKTSIEIFQYLRTNY